MTFRNCTGVALLAILACSTFPATMAQLDAQEQELWHAFYNATGGPNWRRCSSHYDTPCLCGTQPVVSKFVKCENNKLKEIFLPRNSMVGELPIDIINQMTSLEELILVGNDDLQLPKDDSKPSFCSDLTICREHRQKGAAKCRLPDYEGTKLTPCSDVAAWTTLYNELGGKSWNKCSEHRLTPCFCGTYPELDGKRLVCDTDFNIIEITLPNNNMRGEINAEALEYLTQLRTLRITLNPDLVVDKCLNLPMCSSSGGLCELPVGMETCTLTGDEPAPTKTPTVKPTPLTPAPTPFPTASPVVAIDVSWDDLRGWQALYDATDGKNWNACHNSRDQPCSCTTTGAIKVTCQALDSTKPDVKSITGIELPGIGLKGFVPSRDINRLRKLKTLDLSGNPELTTQDGAVCVLLNRCNSGRATCGLPETAPLCPGFIDFAQGTFAPTTPEQIDMIDWVAFYDDSKGETWTRCSEHRATPCDCNHSDEVKVECNANGRITKIKLRNNNLIGVLSGQQFTSFTEMNRLDIRDNPELRMLGNECLRMDECVDGGAITCNLDPDRVKVCEPILTRVESGVAVHFLGYSFALEVFLILGLLTILGSICMCFTTYTVCGCCCFCVVDEDVDGDGHNSRLKDSPEEGSEGGCVVM